MPTRTLGVASQTLRLAKPFRISGHVFETAEVLTVTLSDGEHRGFGEGAGVYYLGDDLTRMRGDVDAARSAVEAGVGRDELRTILPPGGGRNAIDAALWDLEAKQKGEPVWRLAGISEPVPIVTTFTVSADDPEEMAAVARGYAQAKSIKMKLTGDLDVDMQRVRAVRGARRDVWLGVDGNQGFTLAQLPRLIETLVEQDVSLLEQPLRRGRDAELEGFSSAVPIAGDESLLSLADLAMAAGRFDVVNIKLDKCGGLTEGLLMVEEVRRLSLGVMVGTMVGTSLATAPGFVLGQICDLVDLDGPTFLAEDRWPSVAYEDGTLWAGSAVWGAGQVTSA